MTDTFCSSSHLGIMISVVHELPWPWGFPLNFNGLPDARASCVVDCKPSPSAPHQLHFSHDDVTSYTTSTTCHKNPALGGVKLPSLADKLFALLVLPLAPPWCRTRRVRAITWEAVLAYLARQPDSYPPQHWHEGGLGPSAALRHEDDWSGSQQSPNSRSR